MKHAGPRPRLGLFVLATCAALAFVGCDAKVKGGAGVNLTNPPLENENGPPQGGTIGIVITDAPSDEFSVVEVTVCNSAVLQELTFRKTELVKKIATALPDQKIRDMRFRIGTLK